MVYCRKQAQTIALVYQVSLRATCFIITYYRIERFHAGAADGQTFTSLCFNPAHVTDTNLRQFCERGISIQPCSASVDACCEMPFYMS